MYRAYLHLHPHTLNKSSAVPGAFPSASTTNDHTAEFARTIQFTQEKPTQPIGRSSRNQSKNLLAAENNGFFESPVMSRAHAEIKMILEPSRKLIIRDTNSMHGTYVNGLQLHEEETAELQNGTEITFGADVSRGEEVFPAKTFRCTVDWQRSKEEEARIVDMPRTGYGVSSPELMNSEYDSDEDEGDDDQDRESGHHSEDDETTASSGISSTGGVADSISTSACRSTLQTHAEQEQSTVAETKEALEVKSSDMSDQSQGVIEEKTRPKMPSILSLVNKTQTDAEEPTWRSNLVAKPTSEETEFRIIEKPAIFDEKTSDPKPYKRGGPTQPIFVEDDDEYDYEGEEDSDCQMDADSEEDSDSEDEPENPDEEEQMEEDNYIEETVNTEIKDKGESKPEDSDETMKASPKNFFEHTSVPVSQTDARCRLQFPWTRPTVTHSLPPPLPLPGYCPTPAPATTTLSSTVGLHHWYSMNPQPENHEIAPKEKLYAKQDFFEARASNLAAIKERTNFPADYIFSTEGSVNEVVTWNESRPSLKRWASPLYKAEPPRLEMMFAPNENATMRRMEEAVLKQTSDVTAPGMPKLDTEPTISRKQDLEMWMKEDEEDMEEDEEDEYISEGRVFMDEYDSNDDEEIPTTKPVENTSAKEEINNKAISEQSSYGKLSIDDMMNHESPIHHPAVDSFLLLASPPPSEDSQEESTTVEKETETTEDKKISAEATVSTQPLKRKHCLISHVEIPTQPDLKKSEYPTVNSAKNEDIKPEDQRNEPPQESGAQLKQQREVEEPAAKRAKKETPRGAGIMKITAAAFAGAVVGGVGMFAALVASAQ